MEKVPYCSVYKRDICARLGCDQGRDRGHRARAAAGCDARGIHLAGPPARLWLRARYVATGTRGCTELSRHMCNARAVADHGTRCSCPRTPPRRWCISAEDNITSPRRRKCIPHGGRRLAHRVPRQHISASRDRRQRPMQRLQKDERGADGWQRRLRTKPGPQSRLGSQTTQRPWTPHLSTCLRCTLR
jgi:hypothetical protein